MPSGISQVKGGPTGDVADAIVDMLLARRCRACSRPRPSSCRTIRDGQAGGLSRIPATMFTPTGVLAKERGGWVKRWDRSADELRIVAVAGREKRSARPPCSAASISGSRASSCRCSVLRAAARPLAADVAGLRRPTQGQSRSAAGTSPGRRAEARVGVVFQNYALFPHLTVGGNVGFGLKGANWREAGSRRQGRASPRSRATRHLRRPISESALRRPAATGRRRPCAGGRPSCSCSTRPFSALDRGLRETMQVELRRLLKRNRRDLGVRHARSRRGAHHVGPRRRNERRPN